MIYMEEIKKEPVTVGLILINIIVFLAVEFTEHDAYAGLRRSLHTDDHRRWGILPTVYLYVPAFRNRTPFE